MASDKKNKDSANSNEAKAKPSAQSLFRRKPPKGYVNEWIERIKIPLQEDDTEGKSALVFRIGNEWLAITSAAIKEVTEVRPIHKIPHTNSKILLGVTNIHGDLNLMISMQALFDFDSESKTEHLQKNAYPRHIVFGYGHDLFVFKADEVYGMVHFHQEDIEDIPISISKSLANYSSGIFLFKDKRIGILNEKSIMSSIKENYL